MNSLHRSFPRLVTLALAAGPVFLAGAVLPGSPVGAEPLRFDSLYPATEPGVWIGRVAGAGGVAPVFSADGVPLAATPDASDRTGTTFRLDAVPAGTRRLSVGRAGEAEPATVELATWPADAYPATIYHVMMGMFRNGNPGNDGEIEGWKHPNYAGGDLQGVLAAAGHLSRLAVDAVWLSPIFKSRTSHGYDVSNYYAVGDAVGVPDDPAASLALFREVVAELDRRQIGVILDLPLNHASRTYDKKAGDPKGLEPRATAARQEAEKVWDSWGAGFKYWNLEDAQTRRFLIEAALYWLVEEKVAGLRLDYVRGGPHEFWAELHAAIEAKRPGTFLVGECWKDGEGIESNAREIARYQAPVPGVGRQFDALLDFPLQLALTEAFARGGDLGSLETWLQTLPALYGDGALAAPFLDNHDMSRFLSWTDDQRRLAAAVGFLATWSGPIVLFYGTETGLANGSPRPGFTDAGRIPMPWGHLDEALVDQVAAYLQLRRRFPVLARGARLPLAVGPGYLVQGKIAGNERALVGVNLGEESRTVELAAGALTAPFTLSGHAGGPPPEALAGGGVRLVLPPWSTVVAVLGPPAP